MINGMAFGRSPEGDYDLWEDLGNPGWGWGELLPYLKKVRFCKAKSTGNAFRSLQLSAERKLHLFTPEQSMELSMILQHTGMRALCSLLYMPFYLYPAVSKYTYKLPYA